MKVYTMFSDFASSFKHSLQELSENENPAFFQIFLQVKKESVKVMANIYVKDKNRHIRRDSYETI